MLTEMAVIMNAEDKVKLLELRLHKLEANVKDNQGVCRRIRRDIRNIKKTLGDVAVQS